MKQRISSLGLAVLLGISAVTLVPMAVFAAADTCTWDGSTSADWSDGINWTGCDNGGVPENGDTLVFPAGASNTTMNNDLVGLSAASVQVTGTGYNFTGNAITISGAGGLFATESLSINTPITYSAFNTNISAATGKTVTINSVTNFALSGGEVNVGATGGQAGTVDFVGNVTGDASTQFVAVQGAKAIVRGGTNTFTATTVGAEGNARFECRSLSCFGDNANDIYAGGGIVEIYQPGTYANAIVTSVTTPNVSGVWGYGDITLSGNTTVNDELYFGQGTNNKTLTVDGNVDLVSGGLSVSGLSSEASVVINGIISGNYGIFITSSWLTLHGANTYTGATDVSSGNSVLQVMNASGLGASSAGTNVSNGSGLLFYIDSNSTIAEPLTAGGAGPEGLTLLFGGTGTVTYSGAIALTDDATIVATDAGQWTLQGNISGPHNVTYVANTGANPLILNSAKTYTGTTTIEGAEVRVSGTNGIPSADVYVNATSTSDALLEVFGQNYLPDTQRIHTTNNGSRVATVDFGGDETVASIDGNGRLYLAATTTLNASSNTTFSGELEFSSGTSTLVKNGSGTLTLNGTVTVPGGADALFRVEGGTAVISNNYAGMPTRVNSSAILKGTGSTGATLVNSGAVLAVGTSPGCMTFDSLNLSAGSTYQQEITGTTACSQYDKANVNGAVNLGDATLQVSQLAGFNPAQNLVFTIIDGTSLTGTFAGLANGAVFAVYGVNYRINYYASGEVTLTVVSTTANATTPTSTLADTGSSTGLISGLSAIIAAAAIGTFAFHKQDFAFVRRKK